MTSNDQNLSPAIRSALAELRLRIRAYVVAEGLAMAALWVGLTFWIGLALDYLPVLTWASEIPRGLRIVALMLVAAALVWIIYHWILRRLFVRLRDRSMALLMERRFKGFHDELVTSVELTSGHDPDHPFDDQMLQRTARIADNRVRKLRLADVFDPTPLITKSVLAVLLLAPIIPFVLYQPKLASIWFQRFYMMKDVAWPRDTIVEVLGFEPQRTAGATQDGPAELRKFGDSKTMKIAKGSSGTLRIQAKSRTPGKAPPNYCTVYYRSADGVRSSVRMNKVGRLDENGYHVYSLSSKPFKGVLENLEFDVVAADSRLRDYELDVVESPQVVETMLNCKFPDYLVDEETTSWLPRREPYVAGSTSYPIGTEITLDVTSSKPLSEVTVRVGEDGKPQSLDVTDGMTVQHKLKSLDSTTTLFVSLMDTDGVPIERPQKIVIGAVKDNPPELKVLHLGIGSMVTPDVRIPVEGTAKDDHGIDRAWFAMTTPDGKTHEFNDVEIAKDGTVSGGLDLRAKRALETKSEEGEGEEGEGEEGEGEEGEGEESEQKRVAVKVGDRIAVTVMAGDRYNLGEQPNVGVGVRMELEVVTPERLLTALDQRELAQRRVFEHVIEEMTAARDDLARVQRGLEEGDKPSRDLEIEPGEEIDEEQIKRRAAALRLLRVQQAGLQAEKSQQETLGVAAAFDDIVLELKNNRVDSQDRQDRLVSKVAEPLRLIGETMFPGLDNRLEALENAVGADTDKKAEAAKLAVEEIDDILAEMNKVLQDMLYIETYNELVETVRLIMEEQARLRNATKTEQRKGLSD